jgi:hypothetical protein
VLILFRFLRRNLKKFKCSTQESEFWTDKWYEVLNELIGQVILYLVFKAFFVYIMSISIEDNF